MKIDASIILDAKYDQRLMEQGMLQATGYPAERVYLFVEGRGSGVPCRGRGYHFSSSYFRSGK